MADKEIQEWQARVLHEKEELDARIFRLDSYLASNKANEIDNLQRDLMQRQLGYMRAYSSTLRDRIEAF